MKIFHNFPKWELKNSHRSENLYIYPKKSKPENETFVVTFSQHFHNILTYLENVTKVLQKCYENVMKML